MTAVHGLAYFLFWIFAVMFTAVVLGAFGHIVSVILDEIRDRAQSSRESRFRSDRLRSSRAVVHIAERRRELDAVMIAGDRR